MRFLPQERRCGISNNHRLESILKRPARLRVEVVRHTICRGPSVSILPHDPGATVTPFVTDFQFVAG